MSTKTDELRDIFLDLSEDGEVTEPQEEEPSHDAIEDDAQEALAAHLREDGLDEAVDEAFTESS